MRLQDAVDADDERDQVVDRGVALRIGRELRVFAHPFELVHDRVLRFFFPVEQEHVLEQSRQVFGRTDARAVVRLAEQLDVAGQRQHGPGAFAENEVGHVVGRDVEAIARRHALGHEPLDAAEQLLVLQLLVGEADQRFERGLIAEPVVAADLEHLRADEALDQAEHVGVGAALHLAQKARFARAQKIQLVDARQAVGQELVTQVELAAANHVAVDVPANSLGDFDALGIARGVGGDGGGLHGGSSKGLITSHRRERIIREEGVRRLRLVPQESGRCTDCGQLWVGLLPPVEDCGLRPLAESRVARHHDRLRTVLDFELGEDAGDVVAHSLVGQLQHRSDLRVVTALGNQLDELAFARRQRREARVLVVSTRGTEKLVHLLGPARPARVLLDHQMVVAVDRCEACVRDQARDQPAFGERHPHVAVRVQHERRAAHLRQQFADVDLTELADHPSRVARRGGNALELVEPAMLLRRSARNELGGEELAKRRNTDCRCTLDTRYHGLWRGSCWLHRIFAHSGL